MARPLPLLKQDLTVESLRNWRLASADMLLAVYSPFPYATFCSESKRSWNCDFSRLRCPVPNFCEVKWEWDKEEGGASAMPFSTVPNVNLSPAICLPTEETENGSSPCFSSTLGQQKSPPVSYNYHQSDAVHRKTRRNRGETTEQWLRGWSALLWGHITKPKWVCFECQANRHWGCVALGCC